ncbi:MAG: 2-C-methyl-D-erythritol 2,4-cyclodiphosphate synthase [Ignavibacteriaceae bacterium]
MNIEYRTGIGFDVHAFAANRKLIIGGVEIPNEKGLFGHSDADVLIHAICDALLGSLALGDIGLHFPDTEKQFKNADSRTLLKKVYGLINKEGYILGNIDAVIAMQKPKISPYVPEMRKRIAEDLNSGINQVSIKATTTEKLGFVGREEGVSAFATVLIIKNK